MIKIGVGGTDQNNHDGKASLYTRDKTMGLLVYTDPLKNLIEETKFVVNPSFGIAMNQDVGFTGTPDVIHDGTDTTAWTASALSGTWTFNDSTHAGQAIVTVVDYTNNSGDAIEIDGVDITNTTVTEGVEWTAATSNTATATSLATALNAVSGVTATSTGAVVEVIVSNGGDITTFTTTDGTNLPAQAASIDATSATKNREAQLERSSTIDTDDYLAVSLKTYLTTLLTAGVEDIEIRFRLAGADVGNSVNVSGFLNIASFNVWQASSIPISSFGNPGVVDQLIIKQLGASSAADYWVDCIKLQESTGFLEYSYAPSNAEIFTVTKYVFFMIDNVTETQAKAHDKIMGVNKLDNGILAFVETQGEVRPPGAGLLTQMKDFILFPQVDPIEFYDDSTETMMKIPVTQRVILDGRKNERFVFRVQDDLSGLVDFSIFLYGTIENV